MSRWLSVRVQLDRIVALGLLLVLVPVLLVGAILVLLDDGRPVFIKVRRMGRNGKPFGMWKVRSMRAVAAGGLAAGADLTAGDDDRITDAGRRLRKLHVDELPQLVNVVRGEMALIGPRPEAPAYVELDDPRWQRILCAPPGIAGATQVLVNEWEATVLRTSESSAVYRRDILPVKVALDEWYVEKATPALDLRVAFALASSRAATLRRIAVRDVPEAQRLPHG